MLDAENTFQPALPMKIIGNKLYIGLNKLQGSLWQRLLQKLDILKDSIYFNVQSATSARQTGLKPFCMFVIKPGYIFETNQDSDDGGDRSVSLLLADHLFLSKLSTSSLLLGSSEQRVTFSKKQQEPVTPKAACSKTTRSCTSIRQRSSRVTKLNLSSNSGGGTSQSHSVTSMSFADTGQEWSSTSFPEDSTARGGRSSCCQIYGFISDLSGTTAIMSIAGMALEHCTIIFCPLSMQGHLMPCWATFIMAFIWIYSLAFATLLLLRLNQYVAEGYLTGCIDYLRSTGRGRIFLFAYFCTFWCVPFWCASCGRCLARSGLLCGGHPFLAVIPLLAEQATPRVPLWQNHLKLYPAMVPAMDPIHHRCLPEAGHRKSSIPCSLSCPTLSGSIRRHFPCAAASYPILKSSIGPPMIRSLPYKGDEAENDFGIDKDKLHLDIPAAKLIEILRP